MLKFYINKNKGFKRVLPNIAIYATKTDIIINNNCFFPLNIII